MAKELLQLHNAREKLRAQYKGRTPPVRVREKLKIQPMDTLAAKYELDKDVFWLAVRGYYEVMKNPPTVKRSTPAKKR